MIRSVFSFVMLAAAFAAIADEQPWEVGRIQHFALSESSGLVASRRYPGVLWSHNDGGFQFLFAMNERGKYLGAFQVPGTLIDWEDLSIDNAGNLYLADTGSDGMFRTHVAVHRVSEPNPARRFGNAPINRSWYLRFPEGPIRDCEAFFVHGGFGYLLTKRPPISMYRFSLNDTRRSIPLKFISDLPSIFDSAVTSASISLDSQRLALTSSDGVFLFFIQGNPTSARFAPNAFFEFHNFFMEGGTFFRDGFLTCAETRQIWFFTNSAFRCQDPVQITKGLRPRTIGAGKPLRMEIEAVGCPLPRFRWNLNGVPIPGATNAFLDFPAVSVADAGVYEAVAFNRFNAVTNSATLTVSLKPDIRITEVSSSQALDAPAGIRTADWFELSNFEAFPVDLSGWRFNDSIGELADPFVIPDGTIIYPGQTIVLVENLSPQEFRTWWGPGLSQLDPLIITYSGPGLSFRATGDTLTLWDNVSTDPEDIVTRVTFGPADTGVTFIYDPTTDAFGSTAQIGRHGAFRAANSSDIGSPGTFVGIQ